jgi:hypothetical protein
MALEKIHTRKQSVLRYVRTAAPTCGSASRVALHPPPARPAAVRAKLLPPLPRAWRVLLLAASQWRSREVRNDDTPILGALGFGAAEDPFHRGGQRLRRLPAIEVMAVACSWDE